MMTRRQLITGGLALGVAVLGVMWKADTTFNVTATTETVRIRIDSGTTARLTVDSAVMFRDYATEGEMLKGSVEIASGADVTIERVARGPARILIQSGTPGKAAAVVSDSNDSPVGAPVERLVIRIDNPDKLASSGESLVLPFTGHVELGREVGGRPTGHAMLRSAEVSFLGHTVLGERLYDAGRARLDAGDRLVIETTSAAAGFVTVDERPAMTVVYRARGRTGQVFRFGAQGYRLATSFRARILNDTVIQGLWATFFWLLLWYGKLFSPKQQKQ